MGYWPCAILGGMSEVLSENEVVRIGWEPELGAVHVQWLAPTGGEPLRRPLWEALEAMAARGASKWLSDMRLLGMLTRADEQWLSETLFPRAVELGLRYLAIVNPESSRSQVSLRELFSAEPAQALLESDQLVKSAFESVAEARHWLASVE